MRRTIANTNYKAAERQAVDEASRMAESQVLDAIEENLPEGEDQSEWNWEALATAANTRWNLNLRDRDLKKFGREQVAEELIKLAHEAIERIDLSIVRSLLGAGLRRPHRVRVDARQIRRRRFRSNRRAIWMPPSSPTWRTKRPIEAYDQRESEYPGAGWSVPILSPRLPAANASASIAKISSSGPSGVSMPNSASTT